MKATFHFSFLGVLAGVVLVAACGDDDNTATAAATTGPGPTSSTTSGPGGTGGATTGPGGAGGSGGASACGDYCGRNLANCDMANAQYPDPQTCEAVCAHFSPGTAGEMSGDTLACRGYHTDQAANDPAGSCPAAGPYGGGTCGTTQCEAFCNLIQAICTGPNEQYGNEAQCLAACVTLPDATTSFTLDTSATGDTLACRGYHLQAAALDAGLHCPHAGGQQQPCM